MNGSRNFSIMGTPHYMAPEIIKGSGYDHMSDYWSLGIMLYEFIIGNVPFGNDTDDAYTIYGSIINEDL